MIICVRLREIALSRFVLSLLGERHRYVMVIVRQIYHLLHGNESGRNVLRMLALNVYNNALLCILPISRNDPIGCVPARR